MPQQERVILKRVYIGKAAIFGLYYGILVGLMVSGILFIATVLSLDIVADQLRELPNGNEIADVIDSNNPSAAIALSIVFFLFSVFLMPAFFALTALIYNAFSKLGGSFHFEFLEFVEGKKEASQVKII